MNAILTALKSPASSHRTFQARVVFLEDRGSKICKDEWGEWPNLRKGLDFQLKALQKDRDLAHAQEQQQRGGGGSGGGGGGEEGTEAPRVSVELWGDAPVTIEALREALAGP